MKRGLLPDRFYGRGTLGGGLTREMVAKGAESVYATLDLIDVQLIRSQSPRLAALIELANLSSIIGNLLAGGIVKVSGGAFDRAGPHKYQDLRATGLNPEATNIEVKVALEDNSPKGHLAKPGHYLTCRYVLGDVRGTWRRGERGDVVWIWELRFGHLEASHFSLSNTPGDSGKTAVVNKEGMERLALVYLDAQRCPYGPRSRYRASLPMFQ